jgi:predicted amidophosphoribosyltransferase
LGAGLDAVLPSRCLACAVVVDTDDDNDHRGPHDLCPLCREQLVMGPAPGLFVYAGPIVDIIQRAKYSRDLGSALGLARLFADGIGVLADGIGALPPHDVDAGHDGRLDPAVIGAVDVVTFVPAHWTRALARGFDLPALLADGVAARLQRPWRQLLRAGRRDQRLAMASSVEDRARLVAGRFRVKGARSLVGQRVLLVDDVHTTGATLGEATAVLTAAGADVVVVALAFTPPPSAPVDLP